MLDTFLHYFLVVYASISVILGVASAVMLSRMYLGYVPIEKVPEKHRQKVAKIRIEFMMLPRANAAARMTVIAVVSAIYIAITWPFALMR
ncbi:hypothetical protein AhSzq1_25 [Aeromonas phage AhSzq-1]|uniref:Uncharacterized protein n=1 Tax=Aeromonas phage AhSzq-1 TaxID=2138298 RepID=A0A2R4ALL0_9CAUD|nr:hypothetical protein HOT03_gp025 [Aeromonas phage AhSzq-1]AVR75918.1 hypothetical protein AhSzq1_25 [Aeromonas phage AhSzq-1]